MRVPAGQRGGARLNMEEGTHRQRLDSSADPHIPTPPGAWHRGVEGRPFRDIPLPRGPRQPGLWPGRVVFGISDLWFHPLGYISNELSKKSGTSMKNVRGP